MGHVCRKKGRQEKGIGNEFDMLEPWEEVQALMQRQTSSRWGGSIRIPGRNGIIDMAENETADKAPVRAHPAARAEDPTWKIGLVVRTALIKSMIRQK
ncbi:hypothetical protein MMC29_003883 [Sticta canariensis]|nr:hypothetical protein [Sticta canariensis]